MAARSNGGTSRWATTSRAATRPSASPSGTGSTPSIGTAASITIRSASSKSSVLVIGRMAFKGNSRPRLSSLPSELAYNVSELRKYEPLHGQTRSGGGAGQHENRAASRDAGGRPREDGSRPDLLKAQHAKDLA